MVSSYHKVLDRLEEHGSRFSRKGDTSSMAQCPAHDDNNPSLEITKTDGKTLLKDHGGCDTEAVVAALGLSMADLYDDDKRRGNNHDKPVGRRAMRSTTNRTMTKSTWRRAGAFTFIGQITTSALFTDEFSRFCEHIGATPTAWKNVWDNGECPSCGQKTLRAVNVVVPAAADTTPGGSFTLCHCPSCKPADMYKALVAQAGDIAARTSVTDSHVMICEQADGVRFAYPDGVTVHRGADGKGGKKIWQTGEHTEGRHAPYMSDIVRDSLPPRDKVIYLVEGEKDATALRSMGYAAISTLGGAGNVRAKTDSNALLDTVKECQVICVVDNDEGGQGLKWADALNAMLSPHVGKEIKALKFIVGRDGIHDAGDAVATGRFDFDVLGRGVVETPVETPERPHAVKRVGVCRRAEDVQIRKIEWLHEPIIPLDYLTMISGRSGVSKSTLALHYAALASRGKLDGDYAGTPVTVGITAAEDTDSTIKARFVAAGGDVRRLRYPGVAIDTGDKKPVHVTPVFPDEMELLVDQVEANDIKLWIIDPITAMMNGDSNKLTDVRKVLTPLAELAERLHIAIVLITHFNKGGGYASDKVSGSTAWRDAMRSLLIVAQEDKEGGDIVMTLDKSSTTGAAHSSWAYSLTEASVEGVNSDGEAVQVQVTAVGTVMPTTKTVNQVINENNAAGMEVGKPQNHEIEDWLMDVLNDGPMRFKELAQLAKDDMGYTESQLHNAQQRAADRIVSIPDPDHVGRGRPRLWKLATTVQQAGEQ